MNAPEAKNPRSGFHDLVEIRKDLHELPSLPEVACQVSMSWLAGSRRRSNQIAWKVPDGVASIQGKNWSLGAGPPPAVLRGFASDQVSPPSLETKTIAPLCSLIAYAIVLGARNTVGGSRSPGSGLSTNWPGLSMWTGDARKLAPPSVDFWKRKPWSIEVLHSSWA